MVAHNGKAPAKATAEVMADQPLAAPPAWFMEIYQGLSRELISKVMKAGGTLTEAEDSAAAAMFELFKHACKGKSFTNPRAWAHRAVWSHFVRVRERDRAHLQPLDDADFAAADTELTCWENKGWVDQILDQLSPAQREVMESILEGLSTAEISTLYGKTPATIRKNLQLARERLKPLLGQDYQVPAATHPTTSRTQPGEEDAQ